MAVFVGLDCGGSSSRVLAIDERGKILFRGQSGPANILSTPPAIVARNLAQAAKGCPRADSVCGCFAGLIDETARSLAISQLKAALPKAKSYTAEPDYSAALAACGPNTDACVIAGTGSIVCSWLDGKVVKSGGRGPILGDPGSACEVGREMLSRYLDDPSIVSRIFREAVLDTFKTTEDRQIIANLYASASPAKLLATLGKSVAAEAEEGSEEALEIIKAEMHALARLVTRHIQDHGTSVGQARIGLSGGLWKSGAIYGKEFEANLTQLNPDMNFDLFLLRKPPVEGAALLAKEGALVNRV